MTNSLSNILPQFLYSFALTALPVALWVAAALLVLRALNRPGIEFASVIVVGVVGVLIEMFAPIGLVLAYGASAAFTTIKIVDAFGASLAPIVFLIVAFRIGQAGYREVAK
jgi:hypothetical protein